MNLNDNYTNDNKSYKKSSICHDDFESHYPLVGEWGSATSAFLKTILGKHRVWPKYLFTSSIGYFNIQFEFSCIVMRLVKRTNKETLAQNFDSL